MDDFFLNHGGFDADDFLWFDEALPSLPEAYDHHRTSAFADYSSQTLQRFRLKSWGYREPNDRNVHKRMIQFLKRSWKSNAAVGAVDPKEETNHKRMIDERMRRVNQNERYAELHQLLPHGTKDSSTAFQFGDKNSIVKMAAQTIEELRRDVEQLKRRKTELEMALAEKADYHDREMLEAAKIKFRVGHPSSGIDSMLEVLKCFKSTGTTPKALQSSFSFQEFSAVLEIESKIAAADVEKAVQKTLYEVERKLRYDY